MHFEMGKENDVLLFQASGVIDSSSIRQWEQVLRDRASEEAPSGILLDLRIAEYDGSLLELRRHVQHLGVYRDMRLAVVMQEGYQFGLVRAALLLARLSPGGHRVFRHICNARHWIGLPIGPRPLFWRYRCTCEACGRPLLSAA